ncbi:MAG: hypothetical protein QXL94_04720, partial [Candidatus Parvarchaeum sp.]
NMKTFRCFLVSTLVFVSGVAFGDVNPFQETTNTLNSVSQVVVYGLGAFIMILAVIPFALGSIMGCKAYERTKQEQDGNPTTAWVKAFLAFLAWFIPVGLAALAAYYFLGQMLGTSTLHSAIQAICKGLLQLIKIL